MKKIYLIISAYNEEENIPVLLDSLEKNLQSKNIANYEMVFVNDGSSDQTLAELLKAQKKLLSIRKKHWLFFQKM